MNVKLPIDDAWLLAVQSLQENDQIGSATIKLNNYHIGVYHNYALIARNGFGGKRDIYAAVEVEKGCDRIQLKEPAKEFWLAERFIGIPVKNAMQAGTVIHVIEDAAKNGMHAVEAVNYIASRWE